MDKSKMKKEKYLVWPWRGPHSREDTLRYILVEKRTDLDNSNDTDKENYLSQIAQGPHSDYNSNKNNLETI